MNQLRQLLRSVGEVRTHSCVSRSVPGLSRNLHQEFRPQPIEVASSDEEFQSTQTDAPPPNPWLAVSAMGIGAFFAVGIAAIGVYSSFYLAAWAVANNSLFEKQKKSDPQLAEKVEKTKQ